MDRGSGVHLDPLPLPHRRRVAIAIVTNAAQATRQDMA
jgi:hypothetical protein